MPKQKFPMRYPEDSPEHQVGVRLMMRMKYYLRVFEEQYGKIPSFDDMFIKSVELAPEVSNFKEMYKRMFELYINTRAKGGTLVDVFGAIAQNIFADIEIRFALDPTLEVGYLDGYEDKDYEIRTPYSWFTLLHEFVHVFLREQDFPDDERVAYVIPAGIYYFYQFYGKRRSTLEEFL